MQRGSVTYSQKGKQKLVLDGFVYNKNSNWNSAEGERYSWDCEHRKSEGCRAGVTTDDGLAVISTRGEHIHERIEVRSKVLDTLHKVRTEAAVSDTKPAAIINRNVRKRLYAFLPSERNIAQAVRHVRKRNFPPEPQTARDVQLTGNWTQSLSGEAWNIADVQQNGERALVFATEDNLRKLSETSVWFADGTFKVVPQQFKQLYVIHGNYEGRVWPLVYILMTRMTEVLYEAVVLDIVEFARDAFRIRLEPRMLMVDFEVAAHNAFRSVFGNEFALSGCHFHLCQSVNRKVGDVGLRAQYVQDREFALKIRLLPALAYVPVDQVPILFDIVAAQIGPEGADVTQYFSEYYVHGRSIRTGNRGRPRREPPLFEPQMWNCYQQFLDGDPTTNNACEGWHNRLRAIMPRAHPSFWQFILRLKEEQERSEAEMARIDIGEPVSKKRHSRQHRELRLRTLVENARANRQFDLAYLRAVAQNFTL